ncbi:integral membrane protein [Mycobacterium tuberculosis]|nr:integral membrane protein [Mycobacterium tuberculosis]
MTAVSQRPSGPDRRAAAIGAIYAVYAGEGLAFAAVLARSPEIQRAHRFGDDAIDLLVALIPVVGIAGGLLAATLVRRLSPRAVLVAAQVLFHTGVLLVGLARGRTAVICALLLFGVSMGVLDATVNAQAVAAERLAGRSVVNGFFAVWSAMGIAGALWISLANGLDVSLAAGFAVPAAMGLLIAVLTSRLPLPGDAAVGPAEPAAPAPPVPWRPLLAIGMVLACAYVAEGTVSGFAVKYVRDELDAPGTVAPLAIAAFTLTTVLGRSVADRAIRRWGAPRLARGGAAVAMVGLIAVAAAPGPVLAIAGFAVIGAGLCSMAPSAYAAAGGHDPGGRGVAVARVGVFSYTGFVGGAAMVTAVHPMGGYRAAYLIAALFLSVVAALAARFTTVPALSGRAV